MVGDPRTIAAVGPFTSPTAVSTIPITNRAGLLECSPATSYARLTKPEFGALDLRATHPTRINYVRLSPTDDVQDRALADFATHDLDAESALVISAGWDDGDRFAEAFSALGGRVVRTKLPPGGDVNAALEPLRRRSDAPDVIVFAGDTLGGAAKVRRAMHEAGLGTTPFLSWDGILDGSGARKGSFLQQARQAADGAFAGLSAVAPPRADFVNAYRGAFGEEPTANAAAAYACTQVILASLEAAAGDGPSAGELREALRAHAVDPDHRYETVLGTLGFDPNGDSTQQMVSFYRVDPLAADGAGDWTLIKQQDFGPPQ
jgi:ABC-type branched-subunit amino acid transport system substrate-binding protein